MADRLLVFVSEGSRRLLWLSGVFGFSILSNFCAVGVHSLRPPVVSFWRVSISLSSNLRSDVYSLQALVIRAKELTMVLERQLRIFAWVS